MTYAKTKGSERLRNAIAALYNKKRNENILVTYGKIGANILVDKALVESVDRVICMMPTYQQHLLFPKVLVLRLNFTVGRRYGLAAKSG